MSRYERPILRPHLGGALLLALIVLGSGCKDDEIPLYLQGFGAGSKTVTSGAYLDFTVLLSDSPKDITYVDIDPDKIGGWDDYVTFITPDQKDLTLKWKAGDAAGKPARLRGIKITTTTINIPFVLRNTDSLQRLYVDVTGETYGDTGHADEPIPDAAPPDTSPPDTGKKAEAGSSE